MKGRKLRAIRTKLRWTQLQMAKTLKVAANTVARWERDERSISPPMAKLVEIIFATERKSG
jgi:transcriptional regulator with XRE-family HTH domain